MLFGPIFFVSSSLHVINEEYKLSFCVIGILLWEIFSGGKTPYPTMNNVEVVEQVTRRQYRMEQPPLCPPEMYSIMNYCWHEVSPRPLLSRELCLASIFAKHYKTDYQPNHKYFVWKFRWYPINLVQQFFSISCNEPQGKLTGYIF